MKCYDNKHDLIENFNQEKEYIHNIYFDAFTNICDTLYPIYEKILKDVTVLDKTFFAEIIHKDVQLLQKECIEELWNKFKLYGDQKITFKSIENFKKFCENVFTLHTGCVSDVLPRKIRNK